MSTELRNVVPYFSKLQLILNDGTIEMPVKDNEGNRQIGTFRLNSAVFAEILGYNILDRESPVFADVAEFPARRPADDNTSIIMEDVLNAAKVAGYDVVDLLDQAFDEIAETFVSTKAQPVEAAVLGPVVVYRPDAFFADLNPLSQKSVTIKVGVYSAKKQPVPDSETGEFVWVADKLKANRYIVFEDSMTKENRAANVASLQRQIESNQELATAIQQVINAKNNNQELPQNFPYPRYNDYTVVQLTSEKTDIEARIASFQSSIAQLQSIVSGDMSQLIPGRDANGDMLEPTPLQAKVLDAVKGLCIAVLLTLKNSRDDWSEIDVEAIMNMFYLPPV
jgi:hypothetical protein